MPTFHIFPGHSSFVDGAADFIVDSAREAIAERGRCAIALSGGNTPKQVYARLAAEDYEFSVDISKVHVFFGDERCVPPDDARSNFRMASEAMLDLAPIPAENVHRIRGEDDPAQAALAYEQQLQRFFRASQAPPAFDLILLGMGDNGHTASLFPGTASLRETTRWVVPQFVEVMGTWRVTFTAALINAARHVAFIAEGAAKADMLWNVLEGPYQPDVWPAQLIQPANGELHWILDEAIASKVRH